jgi:DNA-binding FadR family transcriptional regulator
MILVDCITPEELVEARLIVEPELAARAAERASLQQVKDLKQSVDAMSRCGSDRAIRMEEDLAFHRGIFISGGKSGLPSCRSAWRRYPIAPCGMVIPIYDSMARGG